MNRILTVISLILFLSSPSFAGSQLLKNATTTGASNYDLDTDGATNIWVTTTFSNTTTMVLVLEGSNDKRITWLPLGSYTIDATDISNGYAGFHVNNRTADHVRPNVTTLSGGGATVTAVTVSHERR